MKKKILPSVACAIAIFFLHGCIQITNTVGNQPVPGVTAKKKVKSKARKTGASVDYAKIQSMIAIAIAEAIDERLSIGSLIDIPYPKGPDE